MSIMLIGMNHQTAPVELREKFALNERTLPLALEELCQGDIQETVALSTCNRLEIYVSTNNVENASASIKSFIAGRHHLPQEKLESALYTYHQDAAVQHLMRVASGLDSMIVGEPQILGQVTQSFEDAHAAKTTGPMLSHLFSSAIHAGKRARTETEISRHTTSVSHAGALLVRQHLGALDNCNILIVGAGEMALLAAQALSRFGGHDLAFINRTYSRAQGLADEMGGHSMAWEDLDEALTWADAVICATGAPHTIIYMHDIETVMNRRGDRELLLLDIAVPRDIEAGVQNLPGVTCYAIDDLQSAVDANMAQRQAAIPHVETIIQEEIATFQEWYHSRQVTPVIKNLREWARSVADDEVEQALNRLQGVDATTEKVINHLVHRLVNRLLHQPTVRLRNHAAEGNGYANTVLDLFGLEPPESVDGIMNGENGNQHINRIDTNTQQHK